MLYLEGFVPDAHAAVSWPGNHPKSRRKALWRGILDVGTSLVVEISRDALGTQLLVL